VKLIFGKIEGLITLFAAGIEAMGVPADPPSFLRGSHANNTDSNG
jgi:hypothetical protein